MTSDFTLYERLRTGLQEAIPAGRPLHELATPERPLMDDLSALPADAEFLRTWRTPRALARLATASGLIAVWLSNPSEALLAAAVALPRLRALYVQDVRKLRLEPLARRPTLEHLMINWAPHLADLAFLAALPALRTLYLNDIKRIDLATLPPMPQLVALHLEGGIWSTIKVPTLRLLDRLPNLRYLSLGNVRPADGSLVPLAGLQQLRELRLPNFYTVEEFAGLAAALPRTTGRALTPFYLEPSSDAQGIPALPCKRCGPPRAMMTGRPASLLCPVCDATRMAKRVARWELARATAAAHPGRAAGE